MSKEELIELAVYNEWAWQRVFPSVAQLTTEAYKQDRGFFWGSLHGMLTHCFSAEWIWPLRIQGKSPTTLRDPADFADFEVLRTQWDPVRQTLSAMIDSISSIDLAREYHYRNTSGKEFAMTIDDTLRHIFVHSIEHRGQITPILYKLGVPTDPLDYIFYKRRVVDE